MNSVCLKSDQSWYNGDTIPYHSWFWNFCPNILIKTACSKSFYTIVFILEKKNGHTFLQWIGRNIPGAELLMGYNTYTSSIGTTTVPWYICNETDRTDYNMCHVLVFLQNIILINTTNTVFYNDYARIDCTTCIETIMEKWQLENLMFDAFFNIGEQTVEHIDPLRWKYILAPHNLTRYFIEKKEECTDKEDSNGSFTS